MRLEMSCPYTICAHPVLEPDGGLVFAFSFISYFERASVFPKREVVELLCSPKTGLSFREFPGLFLVGNPLTRSPPFHFVSLDSGKL